MESDTQQKTSPRRGVAMLVVLSMVVFLTMLGYMGMEMAGRDTQVSGTYLDIASRDQATRSALQLSMARLSADPARTFAQLQLFVADSAKPLAQAHQYLVLGSTTCSLQIADPGYFALGTGGDQSAAKAQIVSLDLGSSSSGSVSGDGIRLTIRMFGRGRNGDIAAVTTTFQVSGVDVPAATIAAPPLINAVYINGTLASTNFGSNVTGNVYINGNVSTNASASTTVSGTLRVNGNFQSNASVTSQGNVVIGGDLYTNSSAPISFQKNAVILGGFNTVNAPISVTGNLESGTPSVVGSWNTGGTFTVGGQYWDKASCRSIGAPVSIAGNAFFDNCLTLAATTTNTFNNLYLGRNAGTATHTFKSGTTNITGNFGAWNTAGGVVTLNGATLNVTGGMLAKAPVTVGGMTKVTGDLQFWNGITNINAPSSVSPSPLALTTGTSAFIQAASQRGDFSSGVTLGGPLTMKGGVDAAFSTIAGNARWSFAAGAASKTWSYENATVLSSALQDPRVAGSSSNNASAWKGTSGAIATPVDLFAAPVPVASTAYAADPLTTQDLDLSVAQTWNQCPKVDTTVLKPLWKELTAAMKTSALAASDNWTAADFQKIYNTQKRADGWLILHIGSSSGLGAINTPGGSFSGKAIWIIDKALSINGNWPASATSSDIQMIYFRTGSPTMFGSPGNLAGYVHYELPYTGTMQWGGGSTNVTLTGALHMRGTATSLTGNGGNTLKVVGSQAVLDAIQQAVPGILVGPGVAFGTPPSSGSSFNLVLRDPHPRFRRMGEYR